MSSFGVVLQSPPFGMLSRAGGRPACSLSWPHASVYTFFLHCLVNILDTYKSLLNRLNRSQCRPTVWSPSKCLLPFRSGSQTPHEMCLCFGISLVPQNSWSASVYVLSGLELWIIWLSLRLADPNFDKCCASSPSQLEVDSALRMGIICFWKI